MMSTIYTKDSIDKNDFFNPMYIRYQRKIILELKRFILVKVLENVCRSK